MLSDFVRHYDTGVSCSECIMRASRYTAFIMLSLYILPFLVFGLLFRKIRVQKNAPDRNRVQNYGKIVRLPIFLTSKFFQEAVGSVWKRQCYISRMTSLISGLKSPALAGFFNHSEIDLHEHFWMLSNSPRNSTSVGVLVKR